MLVRSARWNRRFVGISMFWTRPFSIPFTIRNGSDALMPNLRVKCCNEPMHQSPFTFGTDYRLSSRFWRIFTTAHSLTCTEISWTKPRIFKWVKQRTEWLQRKTAHDHLIHPAIYFETMQEFQQWELVINNDGFKPIMLPHSTKIKETANWIKMTNKINNAKHLKLY